MPDSVSKKHNEILILLILSNVCAKIVTWLAPA